ncbi:hypothetical protein [Massilia sp. 9096]|uniref:hypothetical protein n=1 Tax=Massilia sp. 9096 TaxID=1500894 RepID=UPI000ABFD080|nr:hypothetical protein [Massilia sp. 9096]
MKRWTSILVALPMCWSTGARADVTYDFIRYACVPENGMLDVEYRGLHDSVAGALWDKPTETPKALQRQGFYRARGFQATCTIGQATYMIKASQDEPSEKMCGGVPDIYLEVTRNGRPFFHDVMFGDDHCGNRPSLQRFTIGEITPSWRDGPEAQACYSSGSDDAAVPGMSSPQICQWTFGDADFAKRFPVGKDTIVKLFTRPQK